MARLIVPLVALLLLAGCNGGTVDRHALENDRKSLDSIACEGALVADGVARGRTTVVFARVHSDELRVDAANFADALSSRETEPGIERETRQAARYAARLAHLLKRIHDHPADAATGASVERTLERAGDCS